MFCLNIGTLHTVLNGNEERLIIGITPYGKIIRQAVEIKITMWQVTFLKLSITLKNISTDFLFPCNKQNFTDRNYLKRLVEFGIILITK